MRRIHYILAGVTDDAVFLVDPDIGGPSITNTAALICLTMYRDHGDRRIFYRDTMRNWSELNHELGRFTGFGPIDPARHT